MAKKNNHKTANDSGLNFEAQLWAERAGVRCRIHSSPVNNAR